MDIKSIVGDVLREALEVKNLTPAPDPKHKIKEKPYDHYEVSTEENKAQKKVYRVRFDDITTDFVEMTRDEFVELKRVTPSRFVKGIVAMDKKPEDAKLTTFAKIKKKAESTPEGEVEPHRTKEEHELKEMIKRQVRSILNEGIEGEESEEDDSIGEPGPITGEERLTVLVDKYSFSEILDKIAMMYTNMGENAPARLAKTYAKNFRKYLDSE